MPEGSSLFNKIVAITVLALTATVAVVFGMGLFLVLVAVLVVVVVIAAALMGYVRIRKFFRGPPPPHTQPDEACADDEEPDGSETSCVRTIDVIAEVEYVDDVKPPADAEAEGKNNEEMPHNRP